MRNSQPLGFWICLFVTTYLVAELVGVLGFQLISFDKAVLNTSPWIRIPIVAYICLRMIGLFTEMQKGATAPRWILFAILVATGVSTILLAIPFGLSEYIALGAANLVAASLLLLPSVGRFLKERRNGLAAPGHSMSAG